MQTELKSDGPECICGVPLWTHTLQEQAACAKGGVHVIDDEAERGNAP